jgi:hypothetical protein
VNRLALVCASMVVSILLAACGVPTPPPAPTATPLPSATSSPVGMLTPTPDLCSPAELPKSVSLINFYVKQFEPYASLANIATQEQLRQLLDPMQSIRAATQRQPVPPCLIDLKHDALLWMDTTLQVVSALQAQACATSAARAQLEACSTSLAAGGTQAKKYNDAYAAELARLAGITPVAPSATPALTSTPVVVMVINPGPNPVNLRTFPSLTSQAVGSLAANVSATALGKTTTGDWLLVEIPGQPGKHAWVYASLVEFINGNAAALPVVAH